MDSRLIAGAYSQHFRGLEKEQNDEGDLSDTIARAKKLSQETNKRRRVQAQKRKLEAKKEEQRRQEILTKRREEQKQATEKYQRSHVPTGSRQNSGRLSPQRYNAPCLEDALQLIRRSPRRDRPSSGKERVFSPRHDNSNPLNRSYFNRRRLHSARPSSGRSSHQINDNARAELMDFSLRNLTSSKSLFEQQLEQQQHLLLQEQQQSLKEFSNAVQKELNFEDNVGNNDNDFCEGRVSASSSCSSVDSLEKETEQIECKIAIEQKNVLEDFADQLREQSVSNTPQSNYQQSFYLNPCSSESRINQVLEPSYTPLNRDLTPSALFQKGDENDPLPLSTISNRINEPGPNENNEKIHHQNVKMPLKQVSEESLAESGSSTSSISLIKLSDTNIPERQSSLAQEQQHQMAIQNNSNVFQQKSNVDDANIIQKQKSINVAYNNAPGFAVRNEPVTESYNPRYASAIGLSIWPGPNQTNQNLTSIPSSPVPINSPYGKRTTSVSLATTTVNATQQRPSTVSTSFTTQNTMESNRLYENKNLNCTPNEIVPVSTTAFGPKSLAPETNSSMLDSLKKQDFIYPLNQDPIQRQQNHNLLPMHNNTYNDLQQEIKQLSDKMLETSNISVPASSLQIFNHTHQNNGIMSNFQTVPVVKPAASNSQMQIQQFDKASVVHHIPHANDIVSGPVPVPSVRKVFPATKPPVPKMQQNPRTNTNPKEQEQFIASRIDGNNTQDNDSSKQNETSTFEGSEDVEITKTLKGILKQLPPKVPLTGQQKSGLHTRDSLELAKMQQDKKTKKKSVRFAAFLEETEEYYNNKTNHPCINTISTVEKKPLLTRPSSAKIPSQQSSPPKPVRAASAGSTRQPVSNSHISQHTGKALTTDSSTNTVHSNNESAKNLPPNLSQPLTSYSHTATINRPKAVAHIIMSSEFQKDGISTNPTTSSIHKSQLDAKIKTVNNNFMSKVPVKTNAGSSNVEIYHVSNNAVISPEQMTQQQQNVERSRIRDNSSSLKRVPLSNSTVTRTSIVPASTKINYPVQNGVAPSYTTTQQGSSGTTFEDSKIRIDKTPTDEEINWLWDKVRNCLDKEGVEGGDNRQTTSEQAARQTPTLSTKIIDGNSLGFNTTGAPALRPGSGYFYPRNGMGSGNTTTNNGQNKIKPAIHQQGSYLRRYGLLQQRRVQSATGTPSTQQALQARAGSAGLARYPAANGNILGQQQQTQQTMDGIPQPMAFSYKPQDNVSESTAAFVMAERLAKQSLTDSHIAVGMEDAHSKQEIYNNRARTVSIGGGPSALSLEEQKLMESLDKLNERLNATEQQKGFSGTIHYHQPYQPHLPGFRGHQAFNSQRNQSVSLRGQQQRSQSARIRQQIRQYR